MSEHDADLFVVVKDRDGWGFIEYSSPAIVHARLRKVEDRPVDEQVDDLDRRPVKLRVSHVVFRRNIGRLELVEKLMAHRFEFFPGAITVEYDDTLNCSSSDPLRAGLPADGLLIRHSDFSREEWAAMRAEPYPLHRPEDHRSAA